MRASIGAALLVAITASTAVHARADQAPIGPPSPGPKAPSPPAEQPPPPATAVPSEAAPSPPALRTPIPIVTEPAVVTLEPRPVGNDGAQLAAAGMGGPHERLTTWDVNLDGAYGKIFGDSSEWTGFGRVRGGVLHVRDTMYFMLGGTFEVSDRIAATFGIQGEVLHLSTGLWAQVGALLDIRPRPGFMGAVGWSLFGVEAQQRNDEHFGSVVAVYGKIRIPVRIIAKALGH